MVQRRAVKNAKTKCTGSRGFSYVAGTLRVPSAGATKTRPWRSRDLVTARGACLHGFTLVELLVVIAIIGILVALLLPAVQAARAAARKTQCSNNFKQVGVALHNYESSRKSLPMGMLDHGGFWGWSTHILPYIEEQGIYDMYTLKVGSYWSGPPSRNREASKSWISAYLCPDDPQAQPSSGNGIPISSATPNEFAALGNMCGVSDSVEWMTPNNTRPRKFPEVDGVFGANDSCEMAKIVDGTSKTLAVGEAAGGGDGSKVGNFWATWNLKDTIEGINGPKTAVGGKYPSDAAGPGTASDSAGFSSWHSGGCHFVLADGSVHFVSQDIAQSVLAALTTRNGPSPSNITNYPSKVFSPEAAISGPPW